MALDLPSYLLGKSKGGGGGGTSDYSQLSNKPSINGITLSGNKTSADLGLQNTTQYSTMPTASADNVGQIVQYIGTTDANYTNGYFYICVSDNSSYSWNNLNVQDGSVIISFTDRDSTDALKQKLKPIKYLKDNNINCLVVYYGTGYYTGTTSYSAEIFRITKSNDTTYYLINGFGVSTLSSSAYGTQYIKGESRRYTIIYSNGEISSISQNVDNMSVLSGFIPDSSSNAPLATGNTTAFTPTGDYNPATKKYVDDNKSQFSTMPTANASNVGKIVQYVGTTDSTYTNGYFYACTNDNNTYSWTNINVQAGGSGGGFKTYYYTSSELQSPTTAIQNDFAEIVTKITNHEYNFNIVLDNNGIQIMNNYYTVGTKYYFLFKFFQPGESTSKTTKANSYWIIYDTSNQSVTYAYKGQQYLTAEDKYKTYAGYDATKTQVLKNVQGTLTWVDE